ncbi:MAG: fasciclin domain-containing protein [Thermoguttaceae bacterium]|nr:fasciclin domain-containing protein [Thermoguttaceae bacterium]MDW8080065.1 fasciclin domain-containing protein [Thermoguttaceae bacterium]
MRHTWFAGSLVVVACLVLLAGPARAQEQAPKDIVDTAVAAGKFTTLAKALQAAGLVETLKGKGPFTVFAPTDEAFAKLPAGTLEKLLQNKAELTAVLTYHVVAGEYPAAKVVKTKELKSVQGSPIRIEVSNEGVRVSGARVIQTDIRASNGIIHVIDAVILPPKPAVSHHGSAGACGVGH